MPEIKSQEYQLIKCHFRQPIISRVFACEHGLEVFTREGPGIVCQNEHARSRCGLLFEKMKAAVLPVLGIPDDLTVMPASTITKIQYGGLTALSQEPGKLDPSENINALVEAIDRSYPEFRNLNYGLIIQTIKDYKLRKRRQK